MRRWRLPIAFGLFVIMGAFIVRHIWARQARQKREAGYYSVLRSYSADLKPGLRRSEVESYLHARNLTIRQMCCVDSKEFRAGVWDDLVKIGSENAPWFCSENNVYIAFHFAGQRSQGHTQWDAEGTDELAALSVYHWLEKCL